MFVWEGPTTNKPYWLFAINWEADPWIISFPDTFYIRVAPQVALMREDLITLVAFVVWTCI